MHLFQRDSVGGGLRLRDNQEDALCKRPGAIRHHAPVNDLVDIGEIPVFVMVVARAVVVVVMVVLVVVVVVVVMQPDIEVDSVQSVRGFSGDDAVVSLQPEALQRSLQLFL